MNRVLKISVISVSFLIFGLLSSSSVGAVSLPPQALNKNVSPSAMARLENGQLKACQAREVAIKKRSDQLVALATNMESKFDSIAKRVEDYYTTTVIPSGKSVANYDALVSDIQSKKSAVSTALATAQSDVSSFSCVSDDPKTEMTKFRTDMQAVKSALKDFRTSIKNLIVAVHSVTGTENKETPEPTK